VRYLLDSTFVIDHMRGLPVAMDRYSQMFEAGDEAYANEIVVCEVRAGTSDRDLPSLLAFFEPVEFIQPGPETAMLAGAWRQTAHRRGRHLSLSYALIAAGADALDAAVLTRNVRDFALTPVRIETY
jgi:predicted nucleic acid-binding protein